MKIKVKNEIMLETKKRGEGGVLANGGNNSHIPGEARLKLN